MPELLEGVAVLLVVITMCAVILLPLLAMWRVITTPPPSEQYLAHWRAHHTDEHDHGACTDACGCPARFWRDRVL